MEKGLHEFSELFKQLGLADDIAAIEIFIDMHRILPADIALADAPFWSEAQRALLRQEINADADWAELVDQLNMRLR